MQDGPERAISFSRAVVIGAAGGVGRLLMRLARAEIPEVLGVDREPGNHCCIEDVLTPSRALEDALRVADLIVLALPDSVAETVGPSIIRRAPPDCLVVDTCSVKGPYAAACRQQGSAELMSINPLFGPDLGFEGRTVAITPMRAGSRATLFEHLLVKAGARILHLDPTEHDRAAALNQAVIHAILLTFGSLLSDPQSGAAAVFLTPPARTLLAMAARMLRGGAELHWAIQTKNQFAASARRDFGKAYSALNDLLVAGRESEFAALWHRTMSALGEDTEHFARDAYKFYQIQGDHRVGRHDAEPTPVAQTSDVTQQPVDGAEVQRHATPEAMARSRPQSPVALRRHK